LPESSAGSWDARVATKTDIERLNQAKGENGLQNRQNSHAKDGQGVGAGEGNRTLDTQLGKLGIPKINQRPEPAEVPCLVFTVLVTDRMWRRSSHPSRIHPLRSARKTVGFAGLATATHGDFRSSFSVEDVWSPRELSPKLSSAAETPRA
jgi:hypothetical protein